MNGRPFTFLERLMDFSDHFSRNDPFIKLFSSQVTELDCSLFERQSLLMGGLSDFSSFVVADLRIQGSNE
ncbi:MAG: hypothetical protein RL021_898, partial [Bacteroidota bacterium]